MDAELKSMDNNGHIYPRRSNSSAICAKRNELGLTQSQVADALEVTQATVSRWEAGVLPRKKMLMKLSELLKCDPRDLL